MKALDLTGQVFGRLTAIRLAEGVKKRSWVCRCECGTVTVCYTKLLTKGLKRSCGCLRSELLAVRNATHGMAKTYTYTKWQSMWRRVRDTSGKNSCYVGVTVCDTWKDFANFYRDMGPCTKGESLDRIDNTKGYSKDNCRWVPLKEQAANTTRNVYVYIDGVRVHLSEAARRRGLDPDVVFDRVNKLGWNVDKALDTPARKLNRKV